MKKVLLLLLFTTITYSQNITVRGCNLSYDSDTQIMTLFIPESLIVVKSLEDVVEVILYKSYSLTINEEPMNDYFKYRGYKTTSSRGFSYSSSYMVIYGNDKQNHHFVFPSIEPGEYILEVVEMGRGDKIYDKHSQSLIIK